MFLVQLIYASRPRAGFGRTDIEQILRTAREHNTKAGISGLLVFNSNYFLQCLEGGRGAVNQLYRRILVDPRHDDVVLLDYRVIAQRRFPNWAMGYTGESIPNRETFLKYGLKGDFNPYSAMHFFKNFPVVNATWAPCNL